MKIQERNDLIERRRKLRFLLAQIDEILMDEVPEGTESGTVGIGEKEVVEYLLDIGLSPALSGFRYATTAVRIWVGRIRNKRALLNDQGGVPLGCQGVWHDG